MRNGRLLGVLACLAMALAIVSAFQSRKSGAEAAQGGAPPDPGPNALGLTTKPMPPWFQFQKSATIEGWIEQNDNKQMVEHAWELWGGLTTMTTENVGGQQVSFPIFETWVDETTVFPGNPTPPATLVAAAAKEPAHPFTLPRQFRRARLAGRTAAATLDPESFGVVTVKYTREMYDHVQTNGYFKTSVMQSLNNSWGPSVAIKDRNVKPFPDTSIMLKPTYQVVTGLAATLLPYWTGPADSTNPQAPSQSTWTKRMLVVPPGIASIKIQGIPVVEISDFYHFKLNATEAAYINSLGQGTFKPGDYAILVAMHVSSREIDNWTWQTFWWSIDKPSIPDKVKGHVVAPFDHYNTAVGYSFTTGPDSVAGLNVLCFNPYLEAGFDNSTFVKDSKMLGIESNCMSCHRAATWPPPSYNANQYYTANGILEPGDPYFAGSTKVDFSWGFADDVTLPTSPPAPTSSR